MLYTIPDYYKKFQCTAQECEDTCCAGWQIAVDGRSLKNYKAVRDDYRKTLHKGIRWYRGVFKQKEDKRCAFLNEDNLCDMYIHLGKESLCKTCRLYPRHIEEFEGVREISLSVSCPEVARILLNKKDKTRFLSKEKEGEEEYDDFDPFLYSLLVDMREAIFEILQNRDLDLDVRCGLVYGMAHDVQYRVDKGETFSCYDVLEKYKRLPAQKFVERKVAENRAERNGIYEFYKERFHDLYRLELLKEDWDYQLLEVEEWLFRKESSEEYWDITEKFEAWIKDAQFPWEIQKEQLLVYFIYTYFCGAVYDGYILEKTQMALLMPALLEEMLKVRWILNEKNLDMEDVVELTYRFSREVEHSDINLKRMEAMMPPEHGLFC